MTPQDWESLKPLFAQARGLAPKERGAFVQSVCKKDETLGRKLVELLARYDSGKFDPPLIDFHEFLLTDPNQRNEPAQGETVTMSAEYGQRTIGGRFRVVRYLGKGGMGRVFEAEDLQLKDRVALKMILPEKAADPEIAARFKREILLGKRIAHPNVCRIHDLGSEKSNGDSETLFFTMEFLNGETLASRVRRGAMSPDDALPLIENMADGLLAAHQSGVVHRDFKSGNVMLVDSSDRTRAVITDFGLAQALRENEALTDITRPGAIAGSIDYMAPEQIRGERVTQAADIYAFGVVMFEMVTGKLPFVHNSREGIAAQHLYEAPPSPRKFVPQLEVKWETTILRCLSKTPEARFVSAAELKAALIPQSSTSRRGPTWNNRSALLVLLPMLMFILLGAAFWGYRAWSPGLMASQQRVAVLQFENVGGDKATQAFCEGLMETLSSQLTELEQFQGSLSVVPASDVRKDKVTSARDAQRDFGATLVITGSIQRSPGGTQINVNVVDAKQLKQLRSHGMFIPETETASLQQGVIAQVTSLLDIQLRPEAEHRLAVGNTAVPSAYDFYLQGAGYLLDGPLAADQAVVEFQHSLKQDPDYAVAHAGLGHAYWNKYLATKDRGWIDQAWRECRTAIQLAPHLSEAHITLAILNFGTGRIDEAISEAKQVIAIDPRNDRAYAELARALNARGQTDAAEATIKQAISLRPSYWGNDLRLGNFYANHGRYKEAEASFLRVIDLVPDNPIGYTNLSSIYHLEGLESEAEKMARKSIELRPTPTAYSNLATEYFFERRYSDAVPILEKLTADGTKDYVIWGNLADAYRWTPGDREKAPKAYQQAIALAREAIGVNPRDAAALSSLALYNAKTGQASAALQAIGKALAAAPDDKGVLFSAAVVCELAGERSQALMYIHRATVGGYSPSEIATEPELEKLRLDPLYQAATSPNSGH